MRWMWLFEKLLQRVVNSYICLLNIAFYCKYKKTYMTSFTGGKTSPSTLSTSFTMGSGDLVLVLAV